MKTSTENSSRSRAMAITPALLLPILSFGAGTGTTSFSNPLFNTLLLVIILLAIIIISLGGALKTLIASDIFVERLKKARESKSSRSAVLVLALGAGLTARAQDAAPAPVSDLIGGLEQPTFYTMLCIIVCELIVLGFLVRTFRTIAGEAPLRKTHPAKKTVPVLDKINNTVPIEEEEKITLDHNYDGIRELDNDLPPWWKYGFYLTILVAVVYMIAYHVTSSLPLQADEYRSSVKEAEAEVAEYMKNSASNVDETTVKLLTEKADLEAGRDLFISACAACHGRAGEGGVGPNLTDDYWMHQGGVSDIFKTIKYGWPDKGMKAWKDDYSPMQIAQITSYIKSLRGTNPPNGKEKQGDLFTETVTVPDSLIHGTDTLSELTSQVLR
jgi:cytochrome c oxidase cbb3-type subunit III